MIGCLFLLGGAFFFFTRCFLPVMRMLHRIMFGNEQEVADREEAELRKKIDDIEVETLGKGPNRIRIGIGMHQL